ncbi:hypothetical protein [Azohydromonas aeria]|uniref:hypothetical protein n=1 Tax=Azohydromonas aeria TaxID=2590212 RepID=UPI0012FB1B57|nr:hypothetical protein [Azohydromonas aeria]
MAAWRLARSGQWVKLERVLRASADARDFIRHLPYQMYFEGYERAEHLARELDAQTSSSTEARKPDAARRLSKSQRQP